MEQKGNAMTQFELDNTANSVCWNNYESSPIVHKGKPIDTTKSIYNFDSLEGENNVQTITLTTKAHAFMKDFGLDNIMEEFNMDAAIELFAIDTRDKYEKLYEFKVKGYNTFCAVLTETLMFNRFTSFHAYIGKLSWQCMEKNPYAYQYDMNWVGVIADLFGHAINQANKRSNVERMDRLRSLDLLEFKSLVCKLAKICQTIVGLTFIDRFKLDDDSSSASNSEMETD